MSVTDFLGVAGQNKVRIAGLAVVSLALPVTVYMAMTPQTLENRAAGEDVASVEVSPGIVSADVNGGSVPISALAYDSGKNPTSAEVFYEWSMSSTNSVGTLTQASGNITEFKPLNSGCGQITVTARGGEQVITKSVSVAVSHGANVPDCGIETPTPTISPPMSNSEIRVFVTSTKYNANFGGYSGADAKCQERADAASLGGDWVAWLSDADTSAGDRVTHSSNSYKLLNGDIIANNWEDLTDGSLNNPINRTEIGTVVVHPDNKVWTSTDADGSTYRWQDGTLHSCDNWTTSSSAIKYGFVGYATSVTKSWSTTGDTQLCGTERLLYCFEKAKASIPTATSTPVPTATSAPTSTPVSTATPVPEIKKVSYIAIADSFVRKNKSNRNYGTKTFLATHLKTGLISYIKFNLGNLQGRKIEKATLRLRVLSKTKSRKARSGNNQNLRFADSGWSERSITYSNRPPEGTLISAFKGENNGKIIEIDVTNQVDQNKGGNVSFSIDSSGNDFLALYSRESTSTKPTLIIEYY